MSEELDIENGIESCECIENQEGNCIGIACYHCPGSSDYNDGGCMDNGFGGHAEFAKRLESAKAYLALHRDKKAPAKKESTPCEIVIMLNGKLIDNHRIELTGMVDTRDQLNKDIRKKRDLLKAFDKKMSRGVT